MSKVTIDTNTIKVPSYFLGGWNPKGWEGTVEDAMRIALSEIFEHAGGDSPAYGFTKAVFDNLHPVK